MANQPQDVDSILCAAIEIGSADQRAAYLDAACGGDAELRAQVEKLLSAHARAGSFLEQPIAGQRPTEVLDALADRERSADAIAPPADEVPLDFLEPCEVPGRLGKIGPYEVIDIIGRGGMGVVLRAHDPKLNRTVAVKVLAPQFAVNPTARKRFLREAQATAAVAHPHVITIHAVDQTEKTPYLVMECIDALSLQEKIDRCGHLEVKEILRIGAQIAAGLAAAHAHGLVHRDIKPSNILLENHVERVKITDFGLARAVDDVSISRTGEVAGTPEFMSPEQAQAKPVDPRSDLFSLGAVLYAMCTGRSPFRAESTVAVLRRVCDDVPRPIWEVNPDIPEPLVAIIDRLLAKDPEQRFQTAQEVSDLLMGYLAHLQDPANVPPPDASSIRPAADGKTPGPGASLGHGWRRQFLMLAATVLLAVGVSVAATEATGVTHLAATIMRVVTGAGTLVVEVDDPQVSITIDGEDLLITGAGPREVRLKPGQHQVRAAKGGQVVNQELVTIERGDRRVVKVALEPPAKPASKVALASPIAAPAAQPQFPQYERFEHLGPVASPPLVREHEFRRLIGHGGGVTTVCVSPDGTRILSGGDDRTLRLWDVRTGQELRRLDGHSGGVTCVAYLGDGGRVVSGSGDATVRVWDSQTGQEIRTLRGHGRAISGVAALPDGKRVVSASLDKSVRVWDIETGKEVRKFELDDPVCSVAAASDGHRVLCGDAAGNVQLWDLDKGSLLHRLQGHRGDVRAVAFSPDGRRALSARGEDNTARFWDLDSGRELHRLDVRRGWVLTGTAFSPDGSRALVTGWPITFLLDAKTGGVIYTLRWVTGSGGAAIAPDGCYAVVGSDKGVVLWTLPYRVWPKPALAQRLEDLLGLIQSNPRDTQALEQRGRLYACQGRCDDAARDLAAALDCAAGDRAQRDMVIDGMIQDGQVYSRAITLCPDEGSIPFHRCTFLADRSQWEEAVRAAKPVIEPYQAFGWTHVYAFLLLLTGKDEEYRRLCQRVSARYGESPDPPTACRLALICAAGPQSGVEPGRILGWAESAQAEPRDPFHLTAFIAARYRAGQYEKALELAEQVRTQQGFDYAGNIFLRAMALHQLGRHVESRECYEAGLGTLRAHCPPGPNEAATCDFTSWIHANMVCREAKTVLGFTDEPAQKGEGAAPTAAPPENRAGDRPRGK